MAAEKTQEKDHLSSSSPKKSPMPLSSPSPLHCNKRLPSGCNDHKALGPEPGSCNWKPPKNPRPSPGPSPAPVLPLNIRLSLKLMHNKDVKVVHGVGPPSSTILDLKFSDNTTFSSLLCISFNDSLIFISSQIFNGITGVGPRHGNGLGPRSVIRFFGGFQIQDPGLGPCAF